MLTPRVFRRSPGRVRAVSLLVALLVLLAAATPSPSYAAAHRTLEGVVVRIVDGDTIHVRIGDRVQKVRYIGVNTPEVHHPRKGVEQGGREAMEVNRALTAGKRVRLELDVQERDRYGRLLAYVWICAAPASSECRGPGDVMINAELVRRGYAQVMTVPPNVRYQSLFRDLQREARETGRGLWRGV